MSDVISKVGSLRVEPSNEVDCILKDGLLTVTINRPEKRNPLSLGVLESLRRAFESHSDDAELRLAIVTGAGAKAFASGGDLGELSAYRTRAEAEAFSLHGKAALSAIRGFPVPVVARVNGVALGGGAELALACDVRLAASHAKIGLIHGRLKIAPSWGGGHDLMRLVGPSRGLMLLSEATVLGAPEALGAGLFDDVCPHESDFEAWFEQRIEKLRENPPQVMRAFKAATGRLRGRVEADELETENFSAAWAHDDHWAAVEQLKRPAE